MENTANMEITRNVILDLLPLYVANEVSADTRSLFEKYLETDPELANVAKQLEALEKPGNVPVPLKRDDKLKAFRKARLIFSLTTIIIGISISMALIVLTFFIYFNQPGQ